MFDVSPLSDSSLYIYDSRSTKPNVAIVFPNPVNDVLHIKGLLAIDRIEVYSITGQLQLNTTMPNEPINVRNLPKGFYIMKIIDKGMTNIKTVKFIKN